MLEGWGARAAVAALALGVAAIIVGAVGAKTPGGVPAGVSQTGGRWVEAINSDSEHYGGSNVGNQARRRAGRQRKHDQDAEAA